MKPEDLPRRVAVVGTAGSGKTTLARKLARLLDVPHVELDAIHWGPNWTAAPQEIFAERVEEALAGECWTTDGNYGNVRPIVWRRADTVVWLDYPLPLVMTRVTRRTLQRSIGHVELWSGNREELSKALFGRDSIIWYALSTYRRRRRQYPLLFRQPEYAHLHVVHLRSPRAARAWLASLGERKG